jgi:hypothetical protein
MTAVWSAAPIDVGSGIALIATADSNERGARLGRWRSRGRAMSAARTRPGAISVMKTASENAGRGNVSLYETADALY